MCSSFSGCKECEIDHSACNIGCTNKSIEDDEKIIKIVEKWAAEHPLRTRQSEFLKMFPNASLDTNDVLAVQPCCIDSSYGNDRIKANCCIGKTCVVCRREYWLAELEDID